MKITLHVTKRVSPGDMSELMEVSGGNLRDITYNSNGGILELEGCYRNCVRETFEDYNFISRVEISNLSKENSKRL